MRWPGGEGSAPERVHVVDAPLGGSSSCYSEPIGAVTTTPTLDETFFALADPTRRGILESLGGGPATISELAEPFGLTLNGIKKHVGILERADLVATEKVGRARHCRLGASSLDDAEHWMAEYRRAWESRLERFGAYVERSTEES